MDGRVAPQTLFNAEEREEIPKAERILRGTVSTRLWKLLDLPTIGARFGFLTKPKKQHILTDYNVKGGILKSTTCLNLGRTLALNGIKTILIGLDAQQSLTDIALPLPENMTLDQAIEERLGLYHLLVDGFNLSQVVKSTDLPTLDVIPETQELIALERHMKEGNRYEYFLKDNLIPLLKDYEVIIFDNGPNWTPLVENALVASTSVISPMACDFGSYQAIKVNLQTIGEFASVMKLNWDAHILIPTLVDKTKLSQQIYGAYQIQYKDQVLPCSIRRAVVGQEASVKKLSVIESSPSSPLAQDYFEVITAIWKRIETGHGT